MREEGERQHWSNSSLDLFHFRSTGPSIWPAPSFVTRVSSARDTFPWPPRLNDYLYQRIFLELTATRENSVPVGPSATAAAAIGATIIEGGEEPPLPPSAFDSPNPTIFDFSRRGRSTRLDSKISLLTPKRLVNVDEFEKRGGGGRHNASGVCVSNLWMTLTSK